MSEPTVLEQIFDRYEDAIDRLAIVRHQTVEERTLRMQAQAERDTIARRLVDSQDAGAAAEKAAAEWKQKALILAAENANLKKLIPAENLPIEHPSTTFVGLATRVDAPAVIPAGGDTPRDPTIDLPF